MKVLMLGWEFPPHNTGGLGTACYGLVKSLLKKGAEIVLVLPQGFNAHDLPVKLKNLPLKHIRIKRIPSVIQPYLSSQAHHALYGRDLFSDVRQYARKIKEAVKDEHDIDVIHAHDWLTSPAALEAQRLLKKPLVVHVHATELDRGGGVSINPKVYTIEREGMMRADRVIAVSNYTQQKLVHHYHIPTKKIRVVHNGVDANPSQILPQKSSYQQPYKTVLFLGRITLQKGPDYFLYAAQKVLAQNKNVRFVMAGSGDLEHSMIMKSAELGLTGSLFFTGFLKGPQLEEMYRQADVYVMPSVSEPFGITALEAATYATPIILSRQSGVSEVMHHALKADFWDVAALSNHILALLSYPALQQELSAHAQQEAGHLQWTDAAQKCIAVYREVCGR